MIDVTVLQLQCSVRQDQRFVRFVRIGHEFYLGKVEWKIQRAIGPVMTVVVCQSMPL